MIYCSVKYWCSNSSIPGVILHSIFEIQTIPLIIEVNFDHKSMSSRTVQLSWWFCVHKLSMFIFSSMRLLLNSNHQNWRRYCKNFTNCNFFNKSILSKYLIPSSIFKTYCFTFILYLPCIKYHLSIPMFFGTPCNNTDSLWSLIPSSLQRRRITSLASLQDLNNQKKSYKDHFWT